MPFNEFGVRCLSKPGTTSEGWVLEEMEILILGKKCQGISERTCKKKLVLSHPNPQYNKKKSQFKTVFSAS
jgi:hypothetical protein